MEFEADGKGKVFVYVHRWRIRNKNFVCPSVRHVDILSKSNPISKISLKDSQNSEAKFEDGRFWVDPSRAGVP